MLYAFSLVLIISHHEPWADEAQAWLLARDSSLIDLWTKLLHYEGTPGLWHTLLHFVIHLGLPYAGLNMVSGVLGCAAAALVLRYAPFPLFIRLLLPFTYFFCYQYPVVARSYSLLPVLIVACAIVFNTAGERVFLFTMLLCLLAAVSVHALALSLSVWVASQISVVRRSRRAAAVYVAVLVLIVLSAYPAKDVAFPFHAPLTVARVLGVSAVMLGQAFTGHWIPSLAVLGLSIPFLWRGSGFAVFAISTLSMCAVSVIVYWNAWSQGLLFLAWVFAIWIAAKNIELTRPVLAALAIVIVCQCYWTMRAVRYDWSYPYSGSLAAARYLKQKGITRDQLYCVGYSCTAIQPYFAQNTFLNWNAGKTPAYWDWSNRNQSSDPSALFSAARPEFVLVGHKTPSELEQWSGLLKGNGYEDIEQFDGHLFWRTGIMEGEAFELYRRHRDSTTASVVSMSDPATAHQLISGFYGVESNSWRWTARKFSVALRMPAGAQNLGARLEVHLSIPAIQIQKLGTMTVTADLDGRRLDPQSYPQPGNYTYSREVPAEVFRSGVVVLNFRFDKATPPSAQDARELSGIVSSVGLYSK